MAPMGTDIDGLFHDRAVRLWMAAQNMGIVVWLAVIAVLGWVGLDFVIVGVVALLLAFAAGFVFDPRRSWWGAGPAAVLNDPAARGRYRRLMTIWLIAVVGLMLVAPLLIVATGILAPPTA
jgi:hypothetical protein